MYITTSRLLRLLGACLLSICIAAPLVFTHNQIRFQRFLSSHYITFDDFPSVYADTLRSKVFQSLERGTFDYASYFHSNTSTSESQTIPPNIHFIWFKDLYSSHLDVSKIPSDGSHAPHLCANHNPDYTVTVWNATAGRGLLEKHYEWFLPTYDGYKFPIQRIDALKYFILWHFGGIYMDMDISCRRPLDPLLGYPAWFPEASPLGTNNDLMASRPRHPVISLMLENLTKRNRNLIFPYLTIFWSTGPQFASDMLKKWFLETGSHTAADRKDADTWFVLPAQFYSEEYTFFGHSPGGTWHEQDVAVVLWLVQHPIVSFTLAATVLCSCLVPVLWRRRKSWRGYKEVRDNNLEA